MDPSENASIEVLRPKTVPDNLLAWGTVAQVSDIQVKLQLTGGIVCLVDCQNVNSTYAKLVKDYESAISIGKKANEPAKLSKLFRKGQQYVCKILERRTRAGYAEAQDIIATLDPSHIQEDNLPGTILGIANVPLQGAVLSIEDHGYHVDIGFKNITAFLNFDETDEGVEGERLAIGQIIRCCTTEAISDVNDSRVVQLSTTKAMFKKAIFSRDKCSENLLTQKCVLPGSTGFLTVMKVQRNGLIVNFLDEFAGFVGLDHLRKDREEPQKGYKIADTIKCTVLYYNSTTSTFALSIKPKKIAQQILNGLIKNHHVGQTISNAVVVLINGLRYVEFKVGEHRALANVKDALEDDVSTMTKDEMHVALDAAYPEGSNHKCRVKSINYADLTIVLSLRKEFLDLPFVSVEELKPADFIDATIKKHVRDGVVVSFGLNLRAIILNMHLNDKLTVNAKSAAHKNDSKRYPVGKTIRCRVLKIDFDKQPAKVYLTDKEELMQKDMTIIDSYDKSFRGETVNTVVWKLKHDGIIVELFNNVKGFVPRRFCSTAPLRTVSDLFQVGQVISCTIYRVEAHRQSMLLGIIPYDKIMALKKEAKLARKERTKLRELNKIDRKAERQIAAADAKFKNKRQKVAVVEEVKKAEESSGEDNESSDEDDDQDDEEEVERKMQSGSDEDQDEDKEPEVKRKKSRLERSIEAKQREERVRETERQLLDPNRPAQSIADFERLVFMKPDSADAWIRYTVFFLDNVETEKARTVCKRALDKINFRLVKERLKIWLQRIKIEAKYGGTERLREAIDEAAQVNDKLELFLRASKTLVTCGELAEAERLHEETIKLNRKSPDVWIEYATFLMEHKKDLDKSRQLYERAMKSPLAPSDLVYLRSRFAHLEFKSGDVERGKTLFENLLSENPKRKDLWKVYEAAIRKYGTRQLDSDEVREQNELLLQRIATLAN